MRILYALSLLALLVGCATDGPGKGQSIPEASIVEFLEIAERGDYHEVVRAGEEVFHEGWHIPNHAKLLSRFPSSEPQPGRVRYALHRFQGEASVGEVYLVLERESGQVVEYSYFEAMLEPTPDQQVSLKADREVYRLEDQIAVTLANHSDKAIHYDQGCSPQLCQYVRDEWICEERECNGPMSVLTSGDSAVLEGNARGVAGVRSKLKLEYWLAPGGPLHVAYSNEFTIAAR
jgi:hypothetical protein